MPYDRKDYPSSLKNLNETTRLKAIEMINAMLEEGYDEGQAIPIATEQAKDWYENASDKEKQEMQDKSAKELKDHDDHDSRPELLERGVMVRKHDDGWAVQTKTAKQASDVFNTKDEAVKRGREIAKNKETYLEIQDSNGNVLETHSYEEG
ncbi:DUF2188 domain-containing protein [Piscibacillus halophilus]|uniref:Uncharacterized protein YdaT n=1 Tax=Piscibacillus halophilus TaxID=571933 RepID=A0A1H9KC53_9BACI|nr:DUF2188 domain-containing protein [Piscibacillus halophilus]SEQ96776.1 Uncharacterized protein YdaT [Piscibacillus halophilus]